MKHLSLQSFLVVGPLTMGLVACSAALPSNGSKEHASPAPIASVDTESENATSTAEIPADVVEVEKEKKSENGPPKPIINQREQETKQSDLALDQGAIAGGEREHARGPSDPLMSTGPKKEEGEMEGGVFGGVLGGVPGGIASNARGGAQSGHGTSTTGGTGTTGTGIAAATEVRGTIDKAEIQRVVRMHINDVKRCYEQGLQRRPDLEGKVVLKFTIGKTGTVVAATVALTTLNDRQVEQCITSAALRWTFPKPTGEGLAVISYPFILKSAE